MSKDVHYPMTKNAYDELRMWLENAPEIDTAFQVVIDTLGNHMESMDKHERLFLSTHLATSIIADALTPCFKDNRYMVNDAVKKIAEEATNKIQMKFNAIDKGEL